MRPGAIDTLADVVDSAARRLMSDLHVAQLAWRESWCRAAYTALAVCGVVFAAWLDYWKLLGFHY